ncbi:hypothetical protein Tco_0685402 [Tanacetum coccineum]
MRPFGYPVTILNTLDPLGKFDGKDDEGFFIGYSINSKAFKVFNTRIRKVEENLHITFLEYKPNVVGSGPDWLFDIDLLTNSMNYEQLLQGIKLIGIPQSSEDAVADDAGKKTNEEPTNEGERNGQEKEGGALNKEDDQNVQDFRAALDNLLIQQKKGYANSTNRDSTISLSVSATGQSFTNADDLLTDPLMLDLEDTGIFSGAYDDEDVGSSRPDIMFTVYACARFQVTPKVSHLHAVKRIFRYLKALDRRDIANITIEFSILAKEALVHSKTKHIEIRHHFIRDSYEKKLIQVTKDSAREHNIGRSAHKGLYDVSSLNFLIASWDYIISEVLFREETGSNSGPRFQDTILWGAKAQIRFKAASKQSNVHLSRVNILGSGEDNMKLMELMKHCTTLSKLVSLKE